jgi:RNA polymerase sigma-70 factor (ECF subfamily)
MDEVYIRKILDGDRGAFKFIISKYKDMAYSIAMSVIRNEYDAEEIIQTSFVNAFNNLHSFRRNSKFSTWFYRIVINESFKLSGKRKTEFIVFNETLPDISNDTLNPLLKLEEDDQKYIINEALKHLPPKECLSLRLYYLEQNSIDEIREITGWSVSDIKVTLHRARIRLKYVIVKVYKLNPKVL